MLSSVPWGSGGNHTWRDLVRGGERGRLRYFHVTRLIPRRHRLPAPPIKHLFALNKTNRNTSSLQSLKTSDVIFNPVVLNRNTRHSLTFNSQTVTVVTHHPRCSLAVFFFPHTALKTSFLFVPIATDEYYSGCHIRLVCFILFVVYPDDSIVILMFTLRNTKRWTIIELRNVFIQQAIELLWWWLLLSTRLDPIGSSVCQYWRWSALIGW